MMAIALPAFAYIIACLYSQNLFLQLREVEGEVDKHQEGASISRLSLTKKLFLLILTIGINLASALIISSQEPFVFYLTITTVTCSLAIIDEKIRIIPLEFIFVAYIAFLGLALSLGSLDIEKQLLLSIGGVILTTVLGLSKLSNKYIGDGDTAFMIMTLTVFFDSMMSFLLFILLFCLIQSVLYFKNNNKEVPCGISLHLSFSTLLLANTFL